MAGSGDNESNFFVDIDSYHYSFRSMLYLQYSSQYSIEVFKVFKKFKVFKNF